MVLKSVLVILRPFSYQPSSSTPWTVRPRVVVVAPMSSTMVRTSVSDRPRQFIEMNENSRTDGRRGNVSGQKGKLHSTCLLFLTQSDSPPGLTPIIRVSGSRGELQAVVSSGRMQVAAETHPLWSKVG